jgi:hypothetical protein
MSQELPAGLDSVQSFRDRRPRAAHDHRATFPRTLRLPSPDEVSRGVVIAYATANFAVYRAVVERLAPAERFRMETQFGPFEMSRTEFETTFPWIVSSASYATGSPSMPGRCYYVQGPPPSDAWAYLVGDRARRAGGG